MLVRLENFRSFVSPIVIAKHSMDMLLKVCQVSATAGKYVAALAYSESNR